MTARSRRGAALALLLLAAALGGCSPEEEIEEADEIAVSGVFGRVPMVAFDAPLPLEEESIEVLTEGEGRELGAGDQALLSYTGFDGRTGQVMREESPAMTRIHEISADGVGEGLYEALDGATEGSRLLVTQPVDDENGTGMLVVVIDVRFTEARGEEQPRPEDDDISGRLPSVSLDEAGAPRIELPDDQPPGELFSAQLIRGTGPQLRPGQAVIAHYIGVEWETGEVIDSTWADRVPREQAIDDLPEGLQLALLDQPVGSRLLIVIPPGQWDGTASAAFVVDILAASGSADDTVVTTPPPAPDDDGDDDTPEQEDEP